MNCKVGMGLHSYINITSFTLHAQFICLVAFLPIDVCGFVSWLELSLGKVEIVLSRFRQKLER